MQDKNLKQLWKNIEPIFLDLEKLIFFPESHHTLAGCQLAFNSESEQMSALHRSDCRAHQSFSAFWKILVVQSDGI